MHALARRSRGWVLVALVAALPACKESRSATARSRAPAGHGSAAARARARAVAAARAVTPRSPGRFAPSLARLAGPYRHENHARPKTCATCHAAIYAEWRESVHAFASLNNPYYRAAFDAFASGARASKRSFCGGCHDPALTLSGKMAAKSFSLAKVADDPDAHLGVTCMTCHGIAKTTTDGNASYTLDTSDIPLPKKNDPASLKAHRARVGRAVLRSSKMCASCHIAFLSARTGHAASVTGIDEYSPWRQSAYSGNKVTRVDHVARKTCIGCHMKKVGGHASHRFAGGHATLAAAIGSAKQLAAVRAMVKSAARVAVAAYGVERAKASAPGRSRLWIDVVISNSGTGHRFPGGALDLRDTWLEVQLLDRDGKAVASAGTRYEHGAADPTALVLKASVASTAGKIIEGHHVGSFRAPVANRAIAPRDALVVRYRRSIDRAQRYPLRVRARLRHRRLARAAYRAGCEQSKSALGRRYRRSTKRTLGVDIDACAAQPVIDIATAEAAIPSAPAAGRTVAVASGWRTQYEQGLGLLHQVVESTAEARAAFDRALARAAASRPAIRARVLWGLGSVSSRQGRTGEALGYFARAQKLVGASPALDYARGLAEQRRFHHGAALRWYQRAARASDDDRVWRGLATCAGTLFRAGRSLSAAHRGLALAPHDTDLLRLQLLALRRLKAPRVEVSAAARAFDRFKRDEALAAIRDRCLHDQAACRRDRQPIPTITLR